MVVSKLMGLEDSDLQALALSKGISYDEYDRDFVINALATFPENDNVDKYVDSVQIGDIVAFRTSEYKVKSAKVVRRSTSDHKLMLETKYGRQFFIDFNDIVWVNTNGYWPKWVYNLMKENENAEAYTD